jgi:plastocyanin
LLRSSTRGVSTVVAAVAMIAILVTGGVSAYYAFALRTNGGAPHSGFSVSLTTSNTQTSVPTGDVLVVIPPGVNANSKLSFEPLNLKLVLGVNSTILFYNEDTVEHIVESIQWPSNTSGFDFFLIQGKTATLQLNATGFYEYNFEIDPAGYNGTATVVAP